MATLSTGKCTEYARKAREKMVAKHGLLAIQQKCQEYHQCHNPNQQQKAGPNLQRQASRPQRVKEELLVHSIFPHDVFLARKHALLHLSRLVFMCTCLPSRTTLSTSALGRVV